MMQGKFKWIMFKRMRTKHSLEYPNCEELEELHESLGRGEDLKPRNNLVL